MMGRVTIRRVELMIKSVLVAVIVGFMIKVKVMKFVANVMKINIF